MRPGRRNPRAAGGFARTALVVACVAVPLVAGARPSVEDLQAQIDALFVRAVPVGTVIPFTGDPSFLPAGFLLCDGSEVSRADFDALFALLGTSHGEGDGSTTFHLPDYRGRFLRGVDAGAGRDPNAASRAPMNPGGNTGDAVGTVQEDATAMPLNPFVLHPIPPSGGHSHDVFDAGEHRHFVPNVVVRGSTDAKGDRDGSPRFLFDVTSITTSSAGIHSHTLEPVPDHAHAVVGGDAETRPLNAYVHWIIKH